MITETKKTAAPVTTLDVMHAMLADGDDAQHLGVALPLAAQILPDLVKAGFGDCAVQDLAGRLASEMHGTFWTEAAARVKRIALGEVTTVDAEDCAAVSRCGYMTAGGAFALGLVAGMRLGGAR